MPFIPIQAQDFPFISSVAFPHIALQWNFGPLFTTLLTSNIIRVSRYNVQWSTLTTKMSSMIAWNSMDCYATYDALCEVREKDRKMLLFPVTAVDLPLDYKQLLLPQSFAFSLENMTCSSETSNRQLNFNDTRYEVSLCDLVDNHLEFVLRTSQNKLYWRQNNMSTGWLIFLTISSLFYFTKVCEHMVDLTSGRRPAFSHTTSTWPFLTAVWYAIEYARANVYFLTEAEEILHGVLIAYVLIQCIQPLLARIKHHAKLRQNKQQQHMEAESLISSVNTKHDMPEDNVAIGALIATQLLLTSNMHFTYDTPFLNIFVFLFGSRSFLKFMNLVHTHIVRCTRVALTRTVLVGFDATVFAFLLNTAVQMSAHNAQSFVMISCTLILLSVLVGSLLAFVINQKKSAQVENED